MLDEHKKILFKVASAYASNPADREDLVQETVAQLWRSFDRYDDRFRFSTWMYRVALNVAISFVRQEARRARHNVPVDESVLAIADSDQAASSREELRLLQQLIEQLEPLDRALMILYLDGNPHARIAEILGISETNVGTKISRLKQRIRHDLAATN